MESRLTDELKCLDTIVEFRDEPAILNDFINVICGEKLGEGAFRKVFDYNLDPRFVVKVEKESSECNIVEAMIWEEVKMLMGPLAWVKNWFAPVEWVSPNGRILVMRKTGDGTGKKLPPEKVPAFLWDVKLDNFGWYKGNFVCHDYGQFYNFIHYTKRMKNANWYE